MGSYEHSSLISHAQDYQLPIAAVLSYQSCKLFFIKNIPQYSLLVRLVKECSLSCTFTGCLQDIFSWVHGFLEQHFIGLTASLSLGCALH